MKQLHLSEISQVGGGVFSKINDIIREEALYIPEERRKEIELIVQKVLQKFQENPDLMNDIDISGLEGFFD